MNITVQLLTELDACTDGIEAFQNTFPEKNYPNGASFKTIAAYASEHREMTEYAVWLGCYCPAGVEGATWKARLALQRDDADRARLGLLCPAGVKGATWKARLALQRYDWGRAELGCWCPAEVEGATWEARLAVQRNGDDRARLRRLFPEGVKHS